MLLCSKPPSHPARIVPTRLTGLTKFLLRETERPRAIPTPSQALRVPAVPTSSTPSMDPQGRSAMPGTGVPALQAAAFLPAPLSSQGRHQPQGGTRQPSPHPPFTPKLRGSNSLRSLSPRQTQPRGGSCAGGKRQSWTPSRAGTAQRGALLLPGHPQASPQSGAMRIWERHSWAWAPAPYGSSTFTAAPSLELAHGALVTALSPSHGPLCSAPQGRRATG